MVTLSRFASDMPVMDQQFGFALEGFSKMLMSSLLMLAVISLADVKLLGACAAFVPAFGRIVFFVFTSVREVKRISNNAVSPIVTNVAEAVRGRLLARALGQPDFFVARHVRFAEDFLRASYADVSMVQFNTLATQALVLLICATVALYALLYRGVDVAPGVQITHAFLLPYFACCQRAALFSRASRAERIPSTAGERCRAARRRANSRATRTVAAPSSRRGARRRGEFVDVQPRWPACHSP